MIEGKKPEDMGESLTFNIKKWDVAGEVLLGKLLSVEDFTGSKFETTCKSYLFDTDDGKISTILGAASDKQLEGKDLIGHVIYIVFLGQIDLEGGKRCNHFKIVDITGNLKTDSKEKVFK